MDVSPIQAARIADLPPVTCVTILQTNINEWQTRIALNAREWLRPFQLPDRLGEFRWRMYNYRFPSQARHC